MLTAAFLFLCVFLLARNEHKTAVSVITGPFQVNFGMADLYSEFIQSLKIYQRNGEDN
jgi:hypothetical protein